MVDTKSQYLKIKDEIDSAMLNVLDHAQYINGKEVHDFAIALQDYTDSRFVIPCANGTDALQIALMALGLRPGDEVITPSFTYIATTEVVSLLGLTPVFVDVCADTFCIGPEEIKKAITPKTKAIIPVHLYGHPANMDAIMSIAQDHNIYVIEDNAQAMGADYIYSDGNRKKTGTIGHIGCTSFYPSKNLGAYGDGGAIFTNDENLAETLKMIANHGQKKRYYHEIVGCNSRLDTLQAAILNIKLKHLDSYNLTRRGVAKKYNALLSGHPSIVLPSEADYAHHVYHQYTLRIIKGNRDKIKEELAQKGIPTMIYYPVPSHRQPMFSGLQSNLTNLPVTDLLTNEVISLPIHTELDDEQIDFIISNLLDLIN